MLFTIQALMLVLALILSACGGGPDAQNPGLAHVFLDFVMRPEIAAREARYIRYATANRSALELLDDEMCNDPSTYPPAEVLQKLEAGMPLDDEGGKRRQELWHEIRS